MVYPLTYRRPPSQVSLANASVDGGEKQRSINESVTSAESSMSHGIPAALSFDRIVSGGVCPPCTLRDFMNYLRYIEFSAENLQFFLWYRNYCDRFSKLPASEKTLSPEWTVPPAEAEATGYGLNRLPKRLDPLMTEMFENTDFAGGKTNAMVDPFRTPNATPSLQEEDTMRSFDYGSSTDEKTHGSGFASHHSVAQHTFEDAGMKWKPFTAQPYRDELDRIITIYLSRGGPRELNLSARERQAVLHALQNTTHPSALHAAMVSVEYTLRRQAHPNFIRWTICNGNPARVGFARGLGVATIAIGLTADILITLSSAGPRAWRVLPFVAWFLGFATLIAAWKGMCVVLHGMHHRHLRPWELFAEDNEAVVGGAVAPLPSLGGWTAATTTTRAKRPAEKALSMSSTDSSSLISATTNSFEDEPWVPRYKRRNIIRKVFDREIWIQEPALRQIQDTIFLQAILAAFLFSCISVGIFCAVPRGNFY